VTTVGTGRLKVAPVLMAIVLTVLVVLLLGEAAHLFLLLFLAILISRMSSRGTRACRAAMRSS
jgi:hypothetical protein